jgi:hypothetical protein
MGLSFTIYAGPRQRIHSQIRVPWDSRPNFTVSDSRLPILTPPTTRRVTVEVFDPASTREAPVLVCTTPYIVSGLHGNLLVARSYPWKLFLIPLTRKTRSARSRSPRIRISTEMCVISVATPWFLQVYPLPQICTLASRCLAMDYFGFQASCHNIFDTLVLLCHLWNWSWKCCYLSCVIGRCRRLMFCTDER